MTIDFAQAYKEAVEFVTQRDVLRTYAWFYTDQDVAEVFGDAYVGYLVRNGPTSVEAVWSDFAVAVLVRD